MAQPDLYFILNPALGIIKIGIAGSVPERRQSLECGCGVPLEVLRVVTRGGDLEKDLHDAFGPSRLLGEWFSPSDELIDLATGDASIAAFVAASRDRIASWRAIKAENMAREQNERREAARVEREAAAALRSEEKRLKEERARYAEAARAKAAAKREEQQREQRDRLAAFQREQAERELSAQTRLPRPEAVRIAADRREAVAQRARNVALLGIRSPTLIESIDVNPHKTQRDTAIGVSGGA